MNQKGKSDEWYTPKYFFDDFDFIFDLDPCAPDNKFSNVPCLNMYTKNDDGLSKEWFGSVWMNPPFGGRNGHFPWLEKFIKHGNGIGLMTSLTSSNGFQKFIPQMDRILFPSTKTKFINQLGETPNTGQFNGIVLFSIGEKCNQVLDKSKLGIILRINQ